MKRLHWSDAFVFVLLVSAGVALRLALQEVPNFAPVAALALFSGYFFARRSLALAVPLAIMVISDWFLPGYALWHKTVVYGMLALPVLLGGPLQRHLRLRETSLSGAARSMAGLLGCSLLGSVLFFVVTNALCLGWYEPTIEGAVHCYVQAIPFFRYTLAGDMAFAVVTFGTYAAALRLASAPQSSVLATAS